MSYFLSWKRRSCLTMLMIISCSLLILIQLLSNMFSIRNLWWCVSGFVITRWSWTLKNGRRWLKHDVKLSLFAVGVASPLVDRVDLFGLTLNNSLNFGKHITKIITKFWKQLDILCTLSNIWSFRTKLCLYNSYIMSHFPYFSSIWHHCLKSDRKKLDRLHEWALRCLYSDESSQTSTLSDRIGYSIVDRRIQNLLIIVFKTINNYAPENLRDLFRLRDNIKKRRGVNNRQVPKPYTTRYGKNSVKYLAAIT